MRNVAWKQRIAGLMFRYHSVTEIITAILNYFNLLAWVYVLIYKTKDRENCIVVGIRFL